MADIGRVDAAGAAQALGQDLALAVVGRLHRHARDGRAGGHHLDAADIAAMAARPLQVDADVADVAGGAGRAAIHLAMADDAAADAGADLDDQEVRQRTLQAPELAQRHQVDVVVDEDRRGIVLPQQVADREAVPGRHQGRVHQLAALEIDRTGDADADADHRSRIDPQPGQQVAQQHAHARQHHARPLPHVGGLGMPRERPQVGPEHREVEAGGADVDAQQHAERVAELEVLGAAATRRRLQSRFGEHALLDQSGD